jgi:hypothetical protein
MLGRSLKEQHVKLYQRADMETDAGTNEDPGTETVPDVCAMLERKLNSEFICANSLFNWMQASKQAECYFVK